MSDIVDLTVTNWCERVYALTEEIEEAPRVDNVSRGDYKALLAAAGELARTVGAKLYWPQEPE